MNLKSIYKQLLFYLKKHGLRKLIGVALIKFWRNHINLKEVVFFYDLDTWNNDGSFSDHLFVESYDTMASISQENMEQLVRLKNKEIVVSFLDSFFRRGATLWLAKTNKTIVGLQWTLIGGFNGFYSLPISSRDAIILAVEIFPAFRGQAIYSDMTHNLLLKLKEMKISRVYFKVHVTNKSMLRGVSKINSKRVGIVRSFSLFNRHITIWDKKLPKDSVPK